MNSPPLLFKVLPQGQNEPRLVESSYPGGNKIPCLRFPARPVAVEGELRLSYGKVRCILELIQRAGFRQVGLVAEREG